jgi:hypothetical protein
LNNNTGDSFQYFCNLGKKGETNSFWIFFYSCISVHSKFTTPASGRKSVLKNAKVFNFREIKAKQKMINFRVIDFSGLTIYFSRGSKPHIEMPTLELSLKKIMFGRSTGGETVIRIMKTTKRETQGKETHDFWILLDESKLFLGVKTDRSYETIAYTTFEELGSLNFVGFSSIRKTNWIVENGKVFKSY